MLFIALAIVSLLILMFLKVRVEVNYVKERGTNHLKYKISFLRGMVFYNKKVEFKVKVESLEIGVKSETPNVKKKSNIKAVEFIRTTKKLLNNFDGLVSFVRSSLNKVTLRESELHCQIGSGNAVGTAQLIGLFWVLYGQIMALIQEVLIIGGEPIAIASPTFSEKEFSVRYRGIFEFSLGHLIIVILKFFYRWKGKRKFIIVPMIRD